MSQWGGIGDVHGLAAESGLAQARTPRFGCDLSHQSPYRPCLAGHFAYMFDVLLPPVEFLPRFDWAGPFLNDDDDSFLLADRLERVNSSAAVFDDVKIVLRIHSDAMSLVERAREVSDFSQARQKFAGLALDNIDLRIVLVDDEHECLADIECHCRPRFARSSHRPAW